ncbi:hypothetical protein J4Q44_G00039780 [Coregonus suidteri]|uniref:DUF4371 domain-containing protein n=1 Tax=Coregonus suidteri TaxID=861788 RepID=A0AAN8R4B6_9TELE
MDKSLKTLLEKHNTQVRKNRTALKRIIDAAACLGVMEDVMFRDFEGTPWDRSLDEMYSDLCKALFCHDSSQASLERMKNLALSNCVPSVSDLIACSAEALLGEIKKDIRAAPFFAMQIDEHTNASGQFLHSITVGFVDKFGSIQEHFLGFHNVTRRDSQSLCGFIKAQMADFDIKNKLVAYAYDRKVVCARELNQLNTKVREMAPNAVFINSSAHHLGSVLSDGTVCISEAAVFFSQLKGFASFFSASLKRLKTFHEAWSALFKARLKLSLDLTSISRLNLTLLTAVASNYDEVYDTLYHIMNQRQPRIDSEISSSANSLVLILEDFEFAFLLFTYEQVFPNIEFAFDKLKLKAMDVAACQDCLAELICHIQTKKLDSAFESAYQQAANYTEHPGETLRRKMKRSGNGIGPDEDPQTHFKALYHTVLENLISQIQERYTHLDDLRFLELLDRDKSTEMNVHFPTEAFESLAKLYGGFFDMDRLRADLKELYADQGLQRDSVRHCDWIRSQRRNKKSLPELYRLLCLMATIGVSSTGMDEGEHFLKRIEDFAKSAKVQDQLHKDMAMLFIEKDRLETFQKKHIWYDSVTDLWARKTKREAEFIIKTAEDWLKRASAPMKSPGSQVNKQKAVSKVSGPNVAVKENDKLHATQGGAAEAGQIIIEKSKDGTKAKKPETTGAQHT